MTGPVRLDPDGRLWEWLGHTVDIGSPGCVTPIQDYPGLRLVGAAVLAHRDAVTPADLDDAALLGYIVEAHPPWDGNCPACGTAEPCQPQRDGELLAGAYLVRKSTELVQRSRANLAAHDARRRETPA